MSITEALLLPLLHADGARPLITHYDDTIGSRIELSRATVANWAAKTANFLTEECDVEPGDPVAVALPAHWQTLGVLLGTWWCGARVSAAPAGTRAAFVPPDGDGTGAGTVAIVALDPMGMGLRDVPGDGALDYLVEVRAYGDDYAPLMPVAGDTGALGELSVDETVRAARERTAALGITGADRVLSTRPWSHPDGIVDCVLAVLAAGASLVQCGETTPDALAARKASERVTLQLAQ